MSECALAGFRCAGNKKNHQRNSCNKNQSERREKAPRGAPTGRAPGATHHPAPPTYARLRYTASTLPNFLLLLYYTRCQFINRKQSFTSKYSLTLKLQ